MKIFFKNDTLLSGLYPTQIYFKFKKSYKELVFLGRNSSPLKQRMTVHISSIEVVSGLDSLLICVPGTYTQYILNLSEKHLTKKTLTNNTI